MKTRLLITCIVVLSLVILIPQAFAESENLIYGSASFERLPSSVIPNEPYTFEIKFQFTEGTYAIDGLTPIFDVEPEGASEYVNFELINQEINVQRNAIARIQGTVTVDSKIPYEKIFVTISYVGIGLYDVEYKSAWTDSAIIGIEASKPELIIEQHIPEVELLPDTQIKYGEIFTIHAWLPTYDKKPDLLRYYVHVRDSEENQVDATLWFAREDFVYEFDTTHPAYNITKGGKYFIKIEKADGMSPTGSYYKTLEFEIIKQTCRSDLFLAFRTDDSRTACVKPYTLDKLIERGWAKAHTDMGSLDVKPNKDAKIKHCPRGSRLIQGGYYVTDDSTLTVSQKRFDYNGWMVEFANPEEYKQYAYVFVDCITDSPESKSNPRDIDVMVRGQNPQ